IHNRVMTDDEAQDWLKQKVGRYAGTSTETVNGYSASLSPREMEILGYVTHGISNKDIASQLGISQQTVKNHMTAILRKLQVDDRTQAAIYALRHGWVRLEGQ
ncbi:MAG: response regulator transcription factor, partial [Chloroflexota bacterium]